MAKVHKSGAITGKVNFSGKMTAKIFDGMNILVCQPDAIDMTITERAEEHRRHFADAGKIFKKYSLNRKMLWAVGAGMLGSAYIQEKRMSTRTAGNVIRRKRGVLMDASAYFCRCYCLRKIGEFSDEFDGELNPPMGIAPPHWPNLIRCFYDHEREGFALELEEPPMLTYESTFAGIEENRQRIIKDIIPRSDIYGAKAIEVAQENLARIEAQIKKMQNDGIKPETIRYLERKIIIDSAFSHVIASEGIITHKLDIPFTHPLKNPDGTLKLGNLWRRPITRVIFPALPTTLRKVFKSGWVNVRDLTDAVARFACETIIAWDKKTGAVASASSAIVGDQTPTRTHPEAMQIYEKLRQFNKQKQAKRRTAKIIRHKLPPSAESVPMPKPIIITEDDGKK